MNRSYISRYNINRGRSGKYRVPNRVISKKKSKDYSNSEIFKYKKQNFKNFFKEFEKWHKETSNCPMNNKIWHYKKNGVPFILLSIVLFSLISPVDTGVAVCDALDKYCPKLKEDIQFSLKEEITTLKGCDGYIFPRNICSQGICIRRPVEEPSEETWVGIKSYGDKMGKFTELSNSAQWYILPGKFVFLLTMDHELEGARVLNNITGLDVITITANFIENKRLHKKEEGDHECYDLDIFFQPFLGRYKKKTSDFALVYEPCFKSIRNSRTGEEFDGIEMLYHYGINVIKISKNDFHNAACNFIQITKEPFEILFPNPISKELHSQLKPYVNTKTLKVHKKCSFNSSLENNFGLHCLTTDIASPSKQSQEKIEL